LNKNGEEIKERLGKNGEKMGVIERKKIGRIGEKLGKNGEKLAKNKKKIGKKWGNFEKFEKKLKKIGKKLLKNRTK
jgi:hypothetical protein